MRVIWVLSVGVMLSGCKLIDQTTFAPSPEATPAATRSPETDPRTPLLTVGYATPKPDYQEVLRYAVRAAETRAPGVQYDVIAMLPAGGDAAVAQRREEEVMRDIMAQGVPAGRIHLEMHTAQAKSAEEVRVYVR